nr:MAG TPA: hypothetical protein [Bacteriophage sp.]
MKFKEFVNWCNERACDGCWGMLEAMVCIDLMDEIRKIQFWKREKFWKENYEQQVLEEIINPIEKKLEEMSKKCGKRKQVFIDYDSIKENFH